MVETGKSLFVTKFTTVCVCLCMCVPLCVCVFRYVRAFVNVCV